MLELLEGLIPPDYLGDVLSYTEARFRDSRKFADSFALTLYEQNYLPEKMLKDLCEAVYGCGLFEPEFGAIPEPVLEGLRATGAVPVSWKPESGAVTAVYLPEFEPEIHDIDFEPILQPVPSYRYFAAYEKYYGKHPELLPIPPRQFLNMILHEAAFLKAADITFSVSGRAVRVYYHARGEKVISGRVLPEEAVEGIVQYLALPSPYDFGSAGPVYIYACLSPDFSGRILINKKHDGYVVTIRLAENRKFEKGLKDLSLCGEAIEFIETRMTDEESGLRLISGPSLGGKSTTCRAALMGGLRRKDCKAVSVELYMEAELPGVEQINCVNREEFESNLKSLLHQNPDYIYIPEIQEDNGAAVAAILNTGKKVFSTVQAGSISAAILRLTAVSGYSQDQIIQSLHSVIYQRLDFDAVTKEVRPVLRCLRFTEEMKINLYGKTPGEMLEQVSRLEGDDLCTQFTGNMRQLTML